VVKVFSQRVGSSQKRKVLSEKGRGKLLNRIHFRRQSDHHHLIMKSERMKNHNARITYALQLLSVVLYTPQSVPVMWMCYENIRLASKPPVTMNSVSPGTIPSFTGLVINFGCSACILFTSQVYSLFVILPVSPEFLVARQSIALNSVTNLGQSILPPLVCA
jgi:hypothetical protein